MAGARTYARRLAVALVAAGVAAASAASPAAAVRDCPDAQPTRLVIDGQGSLEAAIVDEQGRLFYSATTQKAIMRLDHPDAEPKVLAAGIESPGGLAFDEDGMLLVGGPNSVANGAVGNVLGLSQLLRIHPESGARTIVATGLSMGNGLVRGPDGSVYASDDIGVNIDRIRLDAAGSRVERGWAKLLSPNGLAIDPTGRWLYAAQTFVPAAIARVDLTDPRRVEEYVRMPVEDIASGLDGMTIDGAGRLLVTANVPGEVWRVSTDRSVCRLGGGVPNASAVAVGRGPTGFSARNAYAVGFSGRIIELPGAAAP